MSGTSDVSAQNFRGNDRLLYGLVLGVVSFWLFAQTTLNIAPAMIDTLGMSANVMNIAVSITSLFSGIFIVVVGGLADKVGRLKVTRWGFYLGIAGSLLVAFTPSGALATPVMLLGRSLQGLSAACIMPASLALVKAYWDGEERQRAISIWSIGSWGGSGLCSLFGGLMTENFGWRSIFVLAALVSAVGLVLLRGTPESRAEGSGKYELDLPGVLTFMVAMLALQVLITQGGAFPGGWTGMYSVGCLILVLVFGFLFIRIEMQSGKAFFNFALFRNKIFTGATISNFMLNGVAGTLIVSLQLVQLGGDMNAQQAGFLTLGYAVSIIAFIRVGEKLLRRFGPRKPMLWGCLITGAAVLLLSPANVLLRQYVVLAVIGYILFGVGLAFYATPSTDAALSNLPEEQAGSGSGIYKMASSLGAAFGVAVSAAIFTALSQRGADRNLFGFIEFVGRQDNIAIREAALAAFGFNLLMIVLAIISIVLTVPKTSPTNK